MRRINHKKIRTYFFILSVVLVISVILTVASAYDWQQFQKDLFNSGQTQSTAPTVNVIQSWRQQVGCLGMASIDAIPIVAEEKVFVLDALGGLWAFDATTGIPLWKTDLS